jgi:hypothetical protein
VAEDEEGAPRRKTEVLVSKLSFFILLVTCVGLVGCATWFGETHYFKSVNPSGEPINYYRLKVEGGAVLSSARYASGFFDERALDIYFGESIAQPEGGRIPTVPGAEVISLERKDGGKLLMILSSNSDAIAEQIGQLAENQEIATLLARLIRRDAILGAADAELDLDVQVVRGRILAELGDTLLANVDPNQASPDALQAGLLQFVNALAAGLGSTQPFGNLAEAAAWVDQQRSSLGRLAR